jgi:hypothetical protein
MRHDGRGWERWVQSIAALLVLTSCTPVVTFADVQQTALATGCWPARPAYPTPPPITVTPQHSPTATPPGFIWPTGQPTATRLPTTTPYPRCTPQPGEALAPWPTPMPPPPPYPTMPSRRAGGGSGQKQTLHLPEVVLTVDIATHPTEGWPAVAAAVWSGNDNPERAFVSVYHPATHVWSPAHQVDIGPSALGRYVRSVEVAVTGDGIVHAVWGMSDPDFSDNDPPSGVWTAFSQDYGVTWSQPERIGTDCRQVNDVAATVQGWLVVGLICHDGPNRVQPAVAVRTPSGAWSLDYLPGAIWYFSDGAVALVGDGDAATATVLFLSGPNGTMSTPRALFYTKRLAASAPWQRSQLDISLSGIELGPRMWHARALVYRPPGATSDAITFTWSDASRWHVLALTSLDAGQTWLPVNHIVAPAGGEQIAFAAPVYDAPTNRLASIWTCCASGGWGETQVATQYLRWSAPGSSSWHDPTPNTRVPLLLGGRAVGETVAAQGRNARTAWVAWIEGGNRVEVRSFDLATVLPRIPGGQP